MVSSIITQDSDSSLPLEQLREYLELQVDFSSFSYGPAVQSYILLGAWLNEAIQSISTDKIEKMMNYLKYFPNDINDTKDIVIGTWIVPIESSELYEMSDSGIQFFDIWKKMVPESVFSSLMVINQQIT